MGQQISTKAQATLWERLLNKIGTVNAQKILSLGKEELQSTGMTIKKADYILDFAKKSMKVHLVFMVYTLFLMKM
ncbi:MAG: hypothetical protein PUA61_05920 [Succinatimonas hippei]|nr:hypothetical protein [Succinatimonas hippei]